ncbi:MAG: twin-arginine translocase TatA/TatE family subunit [Ignavibacteriae bacterium]|nr:twin-arginine translocase TatA/TatE family subunit [Ignavibacteriota bacterium]
MFGNLGTTEIVILAVGIFLLFGAKRIPALAKGIGQAMREFKREIRDDSKSAKGL